MVVLPPIALSGAEKHGAAFAEGIVAAKETVCKGGFMTEEIKRPEVKKGVIPEKDDDLVAQEKKKAESEGMIEKSTQGGKERERPVKPTDKDPPPLRF
jgi:hypothetical protein